MSPEYLAPPKSDASSTTKKEVDGAALAAQIAMTLLELGITLTASYIFSKWIAKMMMGNQAGAGGPDDGFMADNGTGSTGGKGGIVARLKNLLVARHEATLCAMMEELEDHQSMWKQQQLEEKKEESQNLGVEEEEQMLAKIQTEKQYAQLQTELQLQHDQSLSTLDSLSPYEMNIAQSNVIDPSNLSVTFGDVGGMDEIKSEIYDLVVLPLLRPDLFMSDSGLVTPPMGILLYGPPGTGKTMLAKAIAKESGATFVNVQLSTIMNKWFGESNKLISATFQLARKLAPSVVFIDEMDAFLSQRDGTEGSAVNSMKSEFLTLWDGLLSERKGRVKAMDDKKDSTVDAEYENEEPLLPTPPIIVLGATNRPYDVDPAILRRLPRSFEIPLPSLQSRLQLLQLFLEKQSMTKAATASLPKVAKLTEGYSGSDLKEVCRAAAWEPVREMTTGASKLAVGIGGGIGDDKSTTPVLKRTPSGFPTRGTKARPVNENDFLLAIQKVKKTGESARDFRKKEFLKGHEERASMAAEISRATNGSDKKTTKKGSVSSNGKKASKGKNDQTPTIDLQQIMALAMAAATSMKSVDENTPRGRSRELSFDDFGLDGKSSSQESEEVDDDGPPEIFEDATG